MAGVRFVILCIGFFAINLNSVQAALTEEDKQKLVAFLLPTITECSKAHPIADGAIDKVFASGKLEDLNHCFVDCLAQGIGIIDANGAVDIAKVNELAKQYLPAGELNNVDEALEKCAASTSLKGCDRVTELLGCASPIINKILLGN